MEVIEKGTTNETVTDAGGRFSINIGDKQSTLLFHFIGFVPSEKFLDGRDSLKVFLSEDCIRDWFDAQKISLYLSSGIVNTPIGGKFEAAFPAYFGNGTLTSSIRYQTNFNKNIFLNGKLKLAHFISNCNFDMDGSWIHRQISFENNFISTANSIEMDFNFRKIGIITGWSHLNFNSIPEKTRNSHTGPVIGLKTWIGGPLRLAILGKAGIYKGKTEFFGEIIRRSRRIDLFIAYQNLNPFSEISLGIGKTFVYRFRRQKG